MVLVLIRRCRVEKIIVLVTQLVLLLDLIMPKKDGLYVLEEMKKRNIVDDKTIIVANHFSHNGKANYDKMVEVASKENVIVG